MFNVSRLLLDDAFKPATPLTNGVISEMLRQFAPHSDISQGSVATHLRSGVSLVTILFSPLGKVAGRAIYFTVRNFYFFANFLLILTVKRFRKSVNI